MRLDRTKYLELIIHHKDFSLYEYPSRFCIIRVPFDKINFSQDVSFSLSIGQLRKLYSIGFFNALNSVDFSVFKYLVIGHRPFDKDFISMYPEFSRKFFRSCIVLFDVYSKYF